MVAYINTRSTSNNSPTPLTQYKLIWERELVCGFTNTTVQSSDSVTCLMHVGGLLGSFPMDCVHACT